MKRVAIVGVAATLVLAVAAVFFLSQPTASSCTYPAPVSSNLPAILKSIGGFDQAQDPLDTIDIESNAVSAATALNANLIGVSAHSPVHEAPVNGGPAATVIPLSGNTPDGDRIVALVAYLSDCSGRIYYDKIDYLGSAPVVTYPRISQPTAASRLHVQTPQLQFVTNPFQPIWTAGGHQIAAS